MNYVFAGDPMCSWCYGFASELDALRRLRPGLKLDIRVAGLWAGGRDPLDDDAKRFRLGHWDKVEAASGVPFNRDAMLARQGFVYDTEPISRAFVSGKHLAPRVDQLHLFRVLQQAFYVEGLDTTSLSVLCGVLQRALAAQGFDHPDDAIRRVMDSREITHATRAEFAQVRSWGLRSFPQFLIQDGERVEVLHSGFAQAEVIAERMALAERIGQTACPALRSVAT